MRLGLGLAGPGNGDKGLGRQNSGMVRGGRVWRTAQETEQVSEKWKKKNELLGRDEELSIKLMRSEIRRDTWAGCHLETGDSKGDNREKREDAREGPAPKGCAREEGMRGAEKKQPQVQEGNKEEERQIRIKQLKPPVGPIS